MAESHQVAKFWVHADKEFNCARVIVFPPTLDAPEVRELIKALTDVLFDLEGKGEK